MFTSGSINVQHNAKAKTPLSLHQWTDAFLIFTSFDLDKFPLEAPDLSKYLSFLREMINCMANLHGGIMASPFVILKKIPIHHGRSEWKN